MSQDFEFVQTNVGKLLLVWAGGAPVWAGVVIQANGWLLASGRENLHLAGFAGFVLGGLYGLYRLGQAVSAVPTRVCVAPDGVTMVLLRSGEETPVPFARLASYRASRRSGAEALRLTLDDATRVRVVISNRLNKGRDFGAMVAAFEAAVGRYRAAAGPAGAE